MATLIGPLFAIYVLVALPPPQQLAGILHWHEFQLHDISTDNFGHQPTSGPHFLNYEVCERYRPQLVKAWLDASTTPFGGGAIKSSRCGFWQPDPDVGTDL